MYQFVAMRVVFVHPRGHQIHPYELEAAIPAEFVGILYGRNCSLEFGLQQHRYQLLVAEKRLAVERVQVKKVQEALEGECSPNLGLVYPKLLLAVPNSLTGDRCFLLPVQQVRPGAKR